MKKTLSLFFLSIIWLQLSCNSQKQNMKSSNGSDASIEAAINDLLKTSNLYTDQSVFAIRKQNVLQLVTDSVDKNNYKIINGLPYQSLTDIKINTKPQKFNENIRSNIGNLSTELPSRYMIKAEKLFYWWDADYAFTQDIYDALKAFGMLEDNTDYNNASTNIDIQYLFCPNDLSKFIKLNPNEIKEGNTQLPLLCSED